MQLNICKIGQMPYDQALQLQYALKGARQQDKIGNTLLLLEHPPVITLGVRADQANIYRTREQLAADQVAVHEVNRGGDVTYHGPGQVIGYPIVQLKELSGGIRWFIQTMEQAMIDLLLQQYRIEAHQRPGKYTGVWVGERKITAFGLAVSQGVTMHGFAFNVNTNLAHFSWINPCGLSLGVTSVAEELGHAVDLNQAFQHTGKSFAEHFGWDTNWITLPALKKMMACQGENQADGEA